MRTTRKKGMGALTFGILMILAGVLLVLLNMGVIPGELKRIIFSWQMLLVIIGLLSMSGRKFIFGGILFFTGGFLLIPRVLTAFPEVFGAPDPNFMHHFSPLLLVLFGILLVSVALFKSKYSRCNVHSKHNDTDRLASSFNGDCMMNVGSRVDKRAIFAGGEYIVLDSVFTGGHLSAVFGGIVLDLRKTNLAEGDIYLDIDVVCGGISLIMPNDWLVESRVICVLGGITDIRSEADTCLPERKLIITGTCTLGGVDILSKPMWTLNEDGSKWWTSKTR
ncbi:MAG: cell wall-active antibiotics response protein [Prevotellaceae bacterium]|jgi:predicted membrane protein|nr:cell wall-active antibiotics response protein [Prevotellaceae bacterium]